MNKIPNFTKFQALEFQNFQIHKIDQINARGSCLYHLKTKTQWSNVNKNTPKFKNPKNHEFKNFKENAWKMWINWKSKGKSDLQALEDKNLWEIWGRKRQIWLRLDQSKKNNWTSVWKVFKKYEEHVRKDFLKHLQIEIRSVENKPWSIEKQIWLIQHQSSTNQARKIQT